jgi:hypothetical protein
MTDAAADWDFDHQRAETAWTVADLIARTDLQGGDTILLDLEFVPGAGDPAPQRDAFVRKLGMFGYQVEAEDPARPGEVSVAVPDVALDADAIWLHEERTTKLALIHGFLPDGWGFAEP